MNFFLKDRITDDENDDLMTILNAQNDVFEWYSGAS
jgi:hypothetical protein